MRSPLPLGVLLAFLSIQCHAFLSPQSKFFKDTLKPNCIEGRGRRGPNNGPLINGQEIPSGNSIKNFLRILEKLEMKYELNSEELLEMILANFHMDEWNLDNKQSAFIEADQGHTGTLLTDFYRPKNLDGSKYKEGDLQKDEECLLFYMLSHRIEQPKNPNTIPPRTQGLLDRNKTSTKSPDLKMEAWMTGENGESSPREYGVLNLRSSDKETIAIGRVLLGIFMGLKKGGNQVEEMTLDQIAASDKVGKLTPENLQGITIYNGIGQEKMELLYTSTVADIMAITAIQSSSQTDFFYNNGKWNSPVCSTEYRLEQNAKLTEDKRLVYSTAQMKAGIDGLILGREAEKFLKNSVVKLSQFLRMYYFPAKGHSSRQVNFCQRRAQFDQLYSDLERKLMLNTILYTFLVNRGTADDNWGHLQKVKDAFKDAISKSDNEHCSSFSSSDKPDCSTPMDLFIVAQNQQGSGRESEYWESQENVTGFLANMGGFRENEGFLTVLINEQEGNKLKEVFGHFPDNKLGCASCNLVHLPGSSSSMNEDKIFENVKNNIREFLEARFKKDEQKEHPRFNYNSNNGDEGGFPSLVVLYFHFGNLKTTASEIRRRVNELFISYREISVFVVTDNPENFQFMGKIHNQFKVIQYNSDPRFLSKELLKDMCKVPANLRYEEQCEKAPSNWNPKYTGSIAGDQIQYWHMQAEYFHRSSNIEFKFVQERDDDLEVCFNRRNSEPNLEKDNCKPDRKDGTSIIYKMSHPCKDVKMKDCDPFFFTVKAKQRNDEPTSTSCEVPICRSPENTKFEIMHHGVRCSGAFGLGSSINILLLLAVALRSLWTIV